jgi:hypothetical protein
MARSYSQRNSEARRVRRLLGGSILSPVDANGATQRGKEDHSRGAGARPREDGIYAYYRMRYEERRRREAAPPQ